MSRGKCSLSLVFMTCFLTSVFFAMSHILFNVFKGSTWLHIHSQLENIVTKAVVADKISIRSWKRWFYQIVADNQWETQWRNYYQFYGDHSRVWKWSADEKRNLKSFIQKNHDDIIILLRFHCNVQHQKLTIDEINGRNQWTKNNILKNIFTHELIQVRSQLTCRPSRV